MTMGYADAGLVPSTANGFEASTAGSGGLERPVQAASA